MTTRTFVEELYTRDAFAAGGNLTPHAGGPPIDVGDLQPPAPSPHTREVLEGGDTHVYYDAGPCQWKGCSAGATFVVGQYDADTQHESEATLRFMCAGHALVVQQLAEEPKQSGGSPP